MAHGVPALHPEERGVLNWSPKANYIEKRGGLPPYINSVAAALVRKGTDRSVAIRIARRVVEKTCATGLWGGRPGINVSPAIRAAACAAHAHMKAIDKGGKALSNEDYGRCIDLSAPVAQELLDLAADLAGRPLDLAPSVAERRRAAKTGAAMPDGRYPIRNVEELKSAIRLAGNGSGDQSAIRRHIIKRARALGATRLIPDSWGA